MALQYTWVKVCVQTGCLEAKELIERPNVEGSLSYNILRKIHGLMLCSRLDSIHYRTRQENVVVHHFSKFSFSYGEKQ